MSEPHKRRRIMENEDNALTHDLPGMAPDSEGSPPATPTEPDITPTPPDQIPRMDLILEKIRLQDNRARERQQAEDKEKNINMTFAIEGILNVTRPAIVRKSATMHSCR